MSDDERSVVWFDDDASFRAFDWKGLEDDDAYAFGCSDGVLVVDGGEGSKIASPVDGAGTRSLVGSHDSDVLTGNLTSETDATVGTKIALYDVEERTATAVDLGVEFASYARDGEQTVVLGTDGALHVIDDVTGEVVEKHQVIEPWELTDEYSDPKPQVVTGGGFAWVTDPRDSSVALFELGTGEERSRATLADVPTSMALINAPRLH